MCVVALTATYVPPDASSAEARTAPKMKPGPTERRTEVEVAAGAAGVARPSGVVKVIVGAAGPALGVGVGAESGGVTPGGVSGVNNSYIGFLLPRPRRHVRTPGPRA